MGLFIKKVVSGGQTGADRAGLEAAKEKGIETGGYCPRNYRTENGYDLSLKGFGLIQTETEDYDERTLLNVQHSDGTVIFSKTDKSGNAIGVGTLLTINTAKDFNKLFIINPDNEEFKEWITDNDIRILNSAGNRESQNKGITEKVFEFLKKNLMIPDKIIKKKTMEHKKFENDIKEIKNDRVSGSVTLTDKLLEAMIDYLRNTNEHSSVIHENIKRQISDIKDGDSGNMLLLTGFIDSFFKKFPVANFKRDEKKRYLDYLVKYKEVHKNANKKISINAIKEIKFKDKTVLLFSNSTTIVSLFQTLGKKKIYPNIIQCESNPEKEGVVQAKSLKAMGFKVKVIDEDDAKKYFKNIDFALLGCDGYNDKLFVNKRGTFDIVFKFSVEKIPVYVLSDSRKYTTESFRITRIIDNTLFETIPLRKITKMITEES